MPWLARFHIFMTRAFHELCYNDCKVTMDTFFLNFSLAVDQWKVFTKIKVNYYVVPLFGTWSHILVPPGTLV